MCVDILVYNNYTGIIVNNLCLFSIVLNPLIDPYPKAPIHMVPKTEDNVSPLNK